MKDSSNKTLTLAPSEKLNKAVEPKPTKKEIVEAMVQIEHPRLVAEWEALKLAQAKEEAALKKIVAAHVRKLAKTLPELRISLGYARPGCQEFEAEKLHSVDAKFDNIILPPDLEKRIVAFHAIKVPYSAPDISTLRKKLTAKMAGYTDPGQRVAKLIADPESKQVLVEMLAALPA